MGLSTKPAVIVAGAGEVGEAREVLADLLVERERRLERSGVLARGRLSNRRVKSLTWNASWETKSARCESASGFTVASPTDGSGGRVAIMKSSAS